uniref:Uncharacterized protein n=1 Tax=Anguilla anguilla TaxID=7936 RepID=A0A0E9VT11_ANGAN
MFLGVVICQAFYPNFTHD